MGQELAAYTPQDIQLMADQVSESRLFPGVATPQAAFTLMMLCQSEGLHPIQALKRYHIIEGRPSMRADAMQAEFQRHRGVIRWDRSDAEVCEARFIHPEHAPEPGVPVRVALSELVEAGIAGRYNPKDQEWNLKDNYRKFPAQMLRARVISQGVRMVLPGVIVGLYTPEEAGDVDDAPGGQVIDVTAGPERPAAPEPPLDSREAVNSAFPAGGRAAARPQAREWAPFADDLVAKLNFDWLEECEREGVRAHPEEWRSPFVRLRLENAVISAGLEDGKIDRAKIAKDGKPDVRDAHKSRHTLSWLLRNDPEWIEEACARYVKGKLSEARKAIGSPLAEDEDDGQPEAVAAKADDDSGEWTEGRD